MHLKDYIRIYDNVVSDSFCDKLIKRFEENSDQWRTQKRENPDRKFKMSFNQIHIMEEPGWEEDAQHLLEIVPEYIEKYKTDCKVAPNQWPINYTYEPPRMKRYEPDGNEFFSPHVDCFDKLTSDRFLVMFLYLEDNDAGQTSFPQLELASECIKGSLIMFPPCWPWLHAGEKPIEKTKYIIGSYLRYV